MTVNKFLLTLAACLWGLVSYADPVSGLITDAAMKPVPKASVLLKGSATAVLSDSTGHYRIEVPGDGADAVLIFSSAQYLSVEMPVNGRRVVDVRLGGVLKPVVPTAAFSGAWQSRFGGSVNTRYIYSDFKQSGSVVNGSLLAVPTAISKHANSVQNGFAPAVLSFSANHKTKDSVELRVVTSFFFGLVSNNNTAFTDIDMRQIFFTIGKPRSGYFKFGRDFGFLGFDALQNDFSLRGTGVINSPRSPTLAAVGGIGSGYLYGDRLAQINYTTPDYHGLKLTVGIFNPLDFTSRGTDVSDIGETNSPQPGMHAKLAYKVRLNKITTFDASASTLSQQNRTLVSDFRSYASDMFAHLRVGPVDLSGYYMNGHGVGSARLFADAATKTGQRRTTGGGYAQATYTIGLNKLCFNYGLSTMDRATEDPATLLKTNQRVTYGYQRKVATYVTIAAEYSALKAQNSDGGVVTNNAYSLGGFVEF